MTLDDLAAAFEQAERLERRSWLAVLAGVLAIEGFQMDMKKRYL